MLGKATILDTVIHAAQKAWGVFHALFVANVQAFWAKIGHVRAMVERGNFESAALGILLKDERDILALETLCLDAYIFGCFQVCHELQQEGNFLWGKV